MSTCSHSTDNAINRVALLTASGDSQSAEIMLLNLLFVGDIEFRLSGQENLNIPRFAPRARYVMFEQPKNPEIKQAHWRLVDLGIICHYS